MNQQDQISRNLAICIWNVSIAVVIAIGFVVAHMVAGHHIGLPTPAWVVLIIAEVVALVGGWVVIWRRYR